MPMAPEAADHGPPQMTYSDLPRGGIHDDQKLEDSDAEGGLSDDVDSGYSHDNELGFRIFRSLTQPNRSIKS